MAQTVGIEGKIYLGKMVAGNVNRRGAMNGQETMKDLRAPTSKKLMHTLARAEDKLRQRTHELRERTKELRCVYGISKICDQPGISLEEMLQKIVELIPSSWQYPDVACARLVLNGRTLKTGNFAAKTLHKQRCNIFVSGRRAGHLEIRYLEILPEMKKAPFLKAEKYLLDVIAERLGKIVEQKTAEQELKSSKERLRDLIRSSEKRREAERKRLAHEIHDELGHALMGLKMDVGRLRDSCPSRDACLKETRSITSFIDTTILNLQRISAKLRPVLLDDFGLAAAIATLAKDFQGRYGIRCEVSFPAGEIPLEEDVPTMLFRCIQELLTNVARHAKATKVVIKLKRVRERLVLHVKDNGRGIPKDHMRRKASFGLLGIRERVSGFGGELRVEGTPGKGTEVTITFGLGLRFRK